MHITRTALALFSLALVPAARAAAQQRADTAHYVVLFSGRPAGEYREWWTNGELYSVYEYNDRGRGPHEEATLRLGDGGVPTSLAIMGHGYLKDSVAERFTNDGGTATWSASSEHGTLANAGRAYYIANAESPVGTQLLVRAALANGGRVPLLPSGEATVEKSGEMTITVNGAPVHVVRYDVGGLGFSPFTLWTDDGAAHFATVSGWSSVVPAGWEGAVPAMIDAQEKARKERYLRLARQLSHKPTGALVIRGARLFDAESATLHPGMTVVMNGARITAVGPDGKVKVPAGATVIDAAGKTLL
ncbi:MAG: hypothetical protein JJD97_16185, partial [Gemmatimonadaceae bacterium]|nr:hypothetical protein [Gemmatimonadaceae bacterium]